MSVNYSQNTYMCYTDILSWDDIRSTAYMKELPKIFVPPFGLKPKILFCSLRLAKKEQSKQNNETSHRPTYVKRNFLLNAYKRKLRSQGIFGGSKTLVAPLLALRVVQQANMWLANARPNCLRQLHISAKTLSEIAGDRLKDNFNKA